MDTEIESHLARLTGLFAEVINSLAGVKPADIRQVESQALLEKMLQHTLSMRMLRNQPLRYPLKVQGVMVYDFSSAIVLSRAVFETFLTFHDTFLSPKSTDDFNFSYCLWRIRGITNLQSYVPISSYGSSQFQSLMAQLDDFKSTLESTDRFKALKPGQRNSALKKGKDDTESTRDYAEAGFAPETFKRFYGYTSSYVHADGHAAYQIRSAKGKHEDQRQMFDMALNIAMLSVSRAILELEKKYQQCRAACDADPEGRSIAGMYSDIAMKIGDPSLREQIRRQIQQREEG